MTISRDVLASSPDTCPGQISWDYDRAEIRPMASCSIAIAPILVYVIGLVNDARALGRLQHVAGLARQVSSAPLQPLRDLSIDRRNLHAVPGADEKRSGLSRSRVEKSLRNSSGERQHEYCWRYRARVGRPAVCVRDGRFGDPNLIARRCGVLAVEVPHLAATGIGAGDDNQRDRPSWPRTAAPRPGSRCRGLRQPSLDQLSLILRGFAVSAFGSTNVITPSFSSALIPLCSILLEIWKLRT